MYIYPEKLKKLLKTNKETVQESGYYVQTELETIFVQCAHVRKKSIPIWSLQVARTSSRSLYLAFM